MAEFSGSGNTPEADQGSCGNYINPARAERFLSVAERGFLQFSAGAEENRRDEVEMQLYGLRIVEQSSAVMISFRRAKFHS